MGHNKRYVYLILIIILAVNILLTVQGIRWGLPDRWNVDQRVTEALKMLADKTLVSPDFYHPPLYSYLLMLVLAPFLIYLKCSGFPIDEAGRLAADSWIKLASSFPGFATDLYIIARSFSCFLGVLIVIVVFMTAKRMYSSGVALFASGILAATMGFVGANHLEISTSLIGLLGSVVVYLCIRAIDMRGIRETVIASFCVGLAVATKLNGVFLAPLPFVAYALIRREAGDHLRGIIILISAFAAGFLLGWPTYFNSISGVMVGYQCYADFLFTSPAGIPVAVNFLNYILQLVVIFGIPFSVFVIMGLAVTVGRLFTKGAPNDKIIILMLLVVPYIIMNGISVHHQHPYTKYIIFIVPQLAIIGGMGAYELLKRMPVIARYLIAIVFFGYSIAYTISGNMQFSSKDVRYQSTRWIDSNIPQGATIEHIDQLDWLFSSSILKDRRIIYLGRDSTTYASKGFYKLNKTGDLKDAAKVIEDYCGKLNKVSPSSEYFIILFPEATDLSSSVTPVSEHDKLISNFISGKFPYELIASFKALNWRNTASVIRGLSYPHNLFWDPIPDNAYMPSVISVYRRRETS